MRSRDKTCAPADGKEVCAVASAEMYISGYKFKREADSSYGGLWSVSFTAEVKKLMYPIDFY